jgi:hypothetical protein
MIHLGLLIAAFVLFVLASIGVTATKVNLLAVGLALVTLSFIFVGR